MPCSRRLRQRVLRVLFGQPLRSFYASELIRHAGTGSGAALRELARLEQSPPKPPGRFELKYSVTVSLSSSSKEPGVSSWAEVFTALPRFTGGSQEK